MRKKEKILLTERMTYIQTLMSKDERIKKQIENGFRLYLENNKIVPNVNGLYYDKKRKINITPAIGAALYYGLESSGNSFNVDSIPTLFDKGQMGSAMIDRENARGLGS